MASEYTPNRRYPLYTNNDKPNLRDQYNGAIREIDTDMQQALTDSSGVASALGAGFDAQHTVRMAIDNCATDSDLSSEATARANADTALGTRITNETSARESADTNLGTRITNETSARESADTALGTRITNETTARQSADTAINTTINQLEAKLPIDGSYWIGVGDSWCHRPSWGNDLKNVLSQYGITFEPYGASAGGWINVGVDNTTVGDRIDQAISAHANDGARCTDVFVITMQNDRSTWSTGDFAQIKSVIKTNYAKLKAAFPIARIHTIFDYDYRNDGSVNFITVLSQAYKAYHELSIPFFDITSILLPTDFDTSTPHLNSNGQIQLAKAMIAMAGGQQIPAITKRVSPFNFGTMPENVSVAGEYFVYSPQTNDYAYEIYVRIADAYDTTSPSAFTIPITSVADNRIYGIYGSNIYSANNPLFPKSSSSICLSEQIKSGAAIISAYFPSSGTNGLQVVLNGAINNYSSATVPRLFRASFHRRFV
jgi:hypothetical protein